MRSGEGVKTRQTSIRHPIDDGGHVTLGRPLVSRRNHGQDDVRRPVRVVKDGLDRGLRDLLEPQGSACVGVDVEAGEIG